MIFWATPHVFFLSTFSNQMFMFMDYDYRLIKLYMNTSCSDHDRNRLGHYFFVYIQFDYFILSYKIVHKLFKRYETVMQMFSTYVFQALLIQIWPRSFAIGWVSRWARLSPRSSATTKHGEFPWLQILSICLTFIDFITHQFKMLLVFLFRPLKMLHLCKMSSCWNDLS